MIKITADSNSTTLNHAKMTSGLSIQVTISDFPNLRCGSPLHHPKTMTPKGGHCKRNGIKLSEDKIFSMHPYSFSFVQASANAFKRMRPELQKVYLRLPQFRFARSGHQPYTAESKSTTYENFLNQLNFCIRAWKPVFVISNMQLIFLYCRTYIDFFLFGLDSHIYTTQCNTQHAMDRDTRFTLLGPIISTFVLDKQNGHKKRITEVV